MLIRKGEQRPNELQRQRVQVEQPVLEEKPHVDRHLVVARPTRVNPFAGAAHPLGDPRLDGRMGVFMLFPDGQLAVADGFERLAQRRFDLVPVGARNQLRSQEPFDVAQAADHIPLQQHTVPMPIVADGVGEHQFIRRRCLRPQCLHRRYSSASAR